jgi:hypothetical protein
VVPAGGAVSPTTPGVSPATPGGARPASATAGTIDLLDVRDGAQIGTFRVPNFRNERQPFHEFTFESLTAPFVKPVAVDWQEGAGRPNGYICTMRLLGTLQ